MAMTYYPDVMVDEETTGTIAGKHAMIQLAAVKFNYETGEIGPEFDRCLLIPETRIFDERCKREFWAKRVPVLQSIVDRMENPLTVLQDYIKFVTHATGGGPVRFWSRGGFDWSFLESYMDEFGLTIPHRYNDVRELRTWIAARHGTLHEPNQDFITHDGPAHDGLVDCHRQIKCLFAARDGKWTEEAYLA